MFTSCLQAYPYFRTKNLIDEFKKNQNIHDNAKKYASTRLPHNLCIEKIQIRIFLHQYGSYYLLISRNRKYFKSNKMLCT